MVQSAEDLEDMRKQWIQNSMMETWNPPAERVVDVVRALEVADHQPCERLDYHDESGADADVPLPAEMYPNYADHDSGYQVTDLDCQGLLQQQFFFEPVITLSMRTFQIKMRNVPCSWYCYLDI